MFEDTSIIIFHKRSCKNRRLNLCSLLSYLQKINSAADIIVIEQDKEEYDKKIITKFNVKYVFDYNESQYYNKARGYNIGAGLSKKKFYCFHDSDIIVQRHVYGFCSKFFDKYEVIGPYNKLMELSEAESEIFYKNKDYYYPRDPNAKTTYIRNANLSGGIMIISREAFNKVNGWDECFVGWGGEDDAMSNKVLKCLKYIKFQSIGLHLYHEKITLDNYYLENCRRLKFIENLTEEQILNNEMAKIV